jgi:hypothetical protein
MVLSAGQPSPRSLKSPAIGSRLARSAKPALTK